MLPAVAMPRLQMKVRAMIRPNNVSEIRSIGSSTRQERISETADIKAALAQSWGSVLVAILADGRDRSAHIGGAKIACRRALALFDSMLDPIGLQPIRRPSQ